MKCGRIVGEMVGELSVGVGRACVCVCGACVVLWKGKVYDMT